MTDDIESLQATRKKRQKRIVLVLSSLLAFLALTCVLQPSTGSQQHAMASSSSVSPRDEIPIIAASLVSTLKSELDDSLVAALKEQSAQQKATIEAMTQELNEKNQKIASLENKFEELKTTETHLTGSSIGKQQKHVVVKGETLSGISQHYYGTAKRWNEIYQANKDSIPNVNNIKTGTVLVIP